MTATAILTDEDIQKRESHRKACAYIKGYVVGYAVNHGMKWNGDPEKTREFEQGWEDSSHVNPTAVHIIYNRLRHGRSHLSSREADQEVLDGRWFYHKVLAKLAEFGVDVKELT